MIPQYHCPAEWRAHPPVVGQHLDAGNQEDARIDPARLGDPLEVALDPRHEDAPLIVGDTGQGAERGHVVLDAKDLLLGDQERLEPSAPRDADQLLVRVLTGRAIGVDVDEGRHPP
jgi:hypothetical protein